MKNKILNPSELVEGQKLWDLRYDEVTFLKFSKDIHDKYPIKCNRNDRTLKTYTVDGKSYESDLSPILYLSNPIEQVNEFPKIMEVSDTKKSWCKRTVIAYDKINNYFIAYDSNSILRVIHWKYARDIKEPVITEYTLEEIASKLGVDVNSIRIKK